MFSAVLGKELRHAWRDRSVLVLVFLAPLLLAGITTVAFGRLSGPGAVTIGVVDHDGGTAAQTLVYKVLPGLRVGGGALVDTRTYTHDAEVENGTRNGSLSAAIVIPAHFGTGVAAGHPPALRLLTGTDSSLGGPVAEAVLRGFTSQIAAVALAVQVTTTGPGARAGDRTLLIQASELRPPVDIQIQQASTTTLTPAGYFAPSMLMLALFLAGQIAARGLVAERARRTLARIAQAAVPMWRVLLAKYLAALLVGLLSGAVLLGVFVAAGTSFGSPWAAAALLVLSAAAMVGVAGLVVLVARTEQQAGSVGIAVVFLLAILGGNFVPPARTSPVLEWIALATPNGWATRAFADLTVAGDHPWTAVGPALLVLAGWALVTGTATAALAGRIVRRAHA
jgi:ABC-2 type transport system permease protein